MDKEIRVHIKAVLDLAPENLGYLEGCLDKLREYGVAEVVGVELVDQGTALPELGS